MIKQKEVAKLTPTSFTADEGLLKRIDEEAWTRKIRSRSLMIRALVAEGLYRAAARRKAGKSVEIGFEK